MRLFLTVLVLFASLVYPQENRTARPKTKTEKTELPAVIQSSTHNVCPQNDVAQTKQADSYDPRTDRLYRWYLIATIGGVIVGIGGVAAIYKQTQATKQATQETARAAKATEDAAIAAKTNSQAIINAERPWLFLEITVTSSTDRAIGEVPQHLGFSVSFKNWGKTPAEVVMFERHLESSGMEPEKELKVPPQYSMEGQVLAHTRMIPAGESWQDQGESFFWAKDYLLPEDWTEIRSSRKRLLFWGRLQYRDVIEEPKTIHELKAPLKLHETYFCYFWSPTLNRFLICGPFGYNKHT